MKRPRAIPRALAALLLLAAACAKSSGAPGDAGAERECASRADCEAKGAGLVCGADGACAACVSDGQCALRERCDPGSRRCVFKAGWGGACALNDECAAGELCAQGLCVAARSAVLCVADACAVPGQRCNRANGVCEEDLGCLADADCAAGELCNVPTNACVPKCTPESQPSVCAPGQKCVESRCSECADSSDCPGGLVCDLGKLQCALDPSSRCATDRDCAVGLVCTKATGFCTVPPRPCSSNEDCLSGQRCDVAKGTCAARACPPDRFEPNPDAAHATSLAEGSAAGLTLCDREEDWFAMSLVRGDRISLTVDADPLFESTLETSLLDAAGRALAQGALALDYTVSRPGTYGLRLRSSDAYVEYGLRLLIGKGTPCDDDRFEPDDDLASAAVLPGAGDYDKLTLCGLDVDLFRIEVPQGKGLKVELESDPTEGAADLVVTSADGKTELARSLLLAPLQIAEVAAEKAQGAVVVKVAAQDASAHAEYVLRVSDGP
jgi:Cys-rich repeat protein